jgi:hypothetical protein
MAGIEIDGVNNKIDLDDDKDTSISANVDDTLVFEIAGSTTAQMTNGDFLINTTTAIQPGSSGGLGVKGDINISDFTNDTSSSALVFTKSRNTTPGSQTIVNNDDQVGAIFFKADDGDASDYNNNVAAITATVDASPGTNDTPGRLTFFTTNDGERTNTERARITSGGYFKSSRDTDYFSLGSSFHEFNNSVNNEQILTLTHHGSSNNAYGLFIKFNDNAPDNATQWFIACHDNAASRFQVMSDGDIQTHDANINSDSSLKENIVDATSKWDDVKALKVRNFNWIKDYHPNRQHKHIGFIAQEFETVFPNLVKENNIAPKLKYTEDDKEVIDGTKKVGDDIDPVMKKSIKQSALIPILTKALQEAMTRIEELETKVEALENA